MKVWNYVILCTVLVLITQFSGFNTGGEAGLANMTKIGFTNSSDPNCPNCINSFDIGYSDIFHFLFSTGAILGILTGLGLAAIGASFFAKGQTENFIILPFITGVLGLFIQTFVAIIIYAISSGVSWAAAIVSLIFIPLTIGFVIALVEFFRGTD